MSLTTVFTTALNPALQSFQTNGWTTALTGIGRGILGLAFLLEFGGALLDYWTNGGAQQFIGKAARLLIITSIPLAMLTNWSSAGGLTGDMMQFVFQDMPGRLGLPTGASPSGSSSQMDSSIQSISTAYSNLVGILWNGPDAQSASASGSSIAVSAAQNACNNDPANCGPGLTPQKADASTSSSHWWDLSAAISSLGQKITYGLMAMYAIVTLALCMIILTFALIFALYGPLFLLNIGMVFGPVLVGFLPWRPMQNFFMRWVSYMITMGAAFVIGQMFAQIIATAMTSFAHDISSQFAAGGSDMYLNAASTLAAGSFPMMVSMLFLALMAFRVEHIASALFGGAALEGGMLGAMIGAKMMNYRPPEKKPPPPPPGGGDKGGGEGEKSADVGGGGGGGGAQTSSPEPMEPMANPSFTYSSRQSSAAENIPFRESPSAQPRIEDANKGVVDVQAREVKGGGGG